MSQLWAVCLPVGLPGRQIFSRTPLLPKLPRGDGLWEAQYLPAPHLSVKRRKGISLGFSLLPQVEAPSEKNRVRP